MVNSAFVPLIGFSIRVEIQYFKAQPSASREPLEVIKQKL
jgi:hypothetical protein